MADKQQTDLGVYFAYIADDKTRLEWPQWVIKRRYTPKPSQFRRLARVLLLTGCVLWYKAARWTDNRQFTLTSHIYRHVNLGALERNISDKVDFTGYMEA